MLRKWEEIPDFMRTPEVRPYWEMLNKKRGQLILKRAFDLAAAVILLIVLLVPMIIIAVMIMAEDSGFIFYRQERVTRYGKHFRIHKFRTMVKDADKIGTAVTAGDDPRITRVGKKLRRLRLDELPQVFDVISGDMSFVGTRPEAARYAEKYRAEWNATLLMPAGITSECSIRYKDEAKLLAGAVNDQEAEYIYLEKVLPDKMKQNLKSIRDFSFFSDIAVMFRTVLAVRGKEYGQRDGNSTP